MTFSDEAMSPVAYDNVKIPFWSLFTTRQAKEPAAYWVAYDNVKIPFWSLFTTACHGIGSTDKLLMIM